MKTLYVIAGGSDGYIDFTFTFDKNVLNDYIRDDDDYDGDGYFNYETILVPDNAYITETGDVDYA